MTVRSKILSGYALITLIPAILAAFQIYTIHSMRETRKQAVQESFASAITSLELMREWDLAEQYVRRSFEQGLESDRSQLEASERDFTDALDKLSGFPSSNAVHEERNRLVEFWNAFREDMDRYRDSLAAGSMTALPADIEDDLERLRAQSTTVYQAYVQDLTTAAEELDTTAGRAEVLSWIALATALVIAFLVSFSIIRSIVQPLSQLTEGTNAVAQGKAFVRLDTSRTDELSLIARDFNALTNRLAELDDMKKSFVSRISHDIRSPLAAMSETIQLLREEIPGPLTDKQRRLLDLSMQSAAKLSSMIGNLLDLSKMEAGVMEYEIGTHDLVPMVRSALGEFDLPARERGLSLEAELPEEPLMVDCDDQRIMQVLRNLLANAVKFSTHSGSINVRCRISGIPTSIPESGRRMLSTGGRENRLALVTVSDSGPGIADGDKERIFQAFHQSRQGKRIPSQGIGIGLAICRTIVEAHCGAIWVQDKPEGGSEFFVLLHPSEEPDSNNSAAIPVS